MARRRPFHCHGNEPDFLYVFIYYKTVFTAEAPNLLRRDRLAWLIHPLGAFPKGMTLMHTPLASFTAAYYVLVTMCSALRSVNLSILGILVSAGHWVRELRNWPIATAKIFANACDKEQPQPQLYCV